MVDKSRPCPPPPHSSRRGDLWGLIEGVAWGAFAVFVLLVKPLAVCRRLLAAGNYGIGLLIALSLGAFVVSLVSDLIQRRLSRLSLALFAVWLITAITVSVMFWKDAPM